MKKTIILIILAILVGLGSMNNNNIEIPSSSIRIRVIANSNSKENQDNKIIIKSALEEEIYKLIKNKNTLDDVDKEIDNQKDYLDSFIHTVAKNNNIDEEITTNYGYNYFPQKEFKGVTYNAGLYKSYVVTLGSGSGDNWWCVLYPPLCLIDENTSDYEYHSLIKDTLDKYN